MNLLRSAKHVASVKHVVITSSLAVNSGLGPPDIKTPTTAESRIPDIPGPFPNAMVAYVAAKSTALKTAEAWVEQQKPTFDVIHIMPSFLIGRDGLALGADALTNSGSNTAVLCIVLNTPFPIPGPKPNTAVHIDDTARIHILALDPAIKGNQSFIASSNGQDGMEWDHAKTIVETHFPEAVKEGVLANSGSSGTVVRNVDVQKTEETFGIKFATYEEQVVSVVGHYLDLLKRK